MDKELLEIFSERSGNGSLEHAEDNVEQPNCVEFSPALSGAMPPDIKDESEEKAIDSTEQVSEAKRDEPEHHTAEDITEILTSIIHLQEQISILSGEVGSVVNSLSSLKGYEEAVRSLQISLAANQRNEKILYADLEKARNDEHFTTVRPFLNFMVSQHGDLIRTRSNYEEDRENFLRENSDSILNEILNLLDNLLLSLENQMEIHGVEIIRYEVGSAFIPIEQNIVKTVLTDDPEKHSTVASVNSFGYRYQSKMLRKANVTVYRKEKKVTPL